MTTVPISPGNRIGSMILDHFIMTGICMVFTLPGMINRFSGIFTAGHEQPALPATNIDFPGMAGFALYFCKDCINGRSIAKRITKLQVVGNISGRPASPLQCFVRNIFCIIWPIEVIATFFSPERRLGDRVAGTRIAVYDPLAEKQRPDYIQIALSLILSLGLLYAMSQWLDNLVERVNTGSADITGIEHFFNCMA